VRPPGLKGQLVSEINLAGIVKSKNQYMAMATGYRGKTYFLQPNDELYDGKVTEIKSDAVIFSQTLTDGQGRKLSQRVVKKLYPTRGEGNDAK
jgi:Tfp pilus assembly protein PilP